MKANSLTLYVEIDQDEFIFFVVQKNVENNFTLIFKKKVSTNAIIGEKIVNADEVLRIVKENIYSIEKKFNVTFKEAVILLNSFNFSFLNLSGFKKLNGSQLLKDNVTYIINTLKSCIDETEKNKTIIHIFNSRYILDGKETNNLPIGLFGDFYAHELSVFLLNSNDQKNLQNIFEKNNLRVKKIILKSYVDGVSLIDSHKNLDTFFKVEMSEKETKLIYFENRALKHVQNFKFGSSLLIKDISKIISFDSETVKNFLSKTTLNNENLNEDLIEKEYFRDNVFRKIKKKLIFDIAEARIKELAEIILFRNTNLTSFIREKTPIFFLLKDTDILGCLLSSFSKQFSNGKKLNFHQIQKEDDENYITQASRLVHFGWNKEAIPVINAKKSFFTRFFDTLFN